MRKEIKGLYNGLAPIHEKYVKGLKPGEPLTISYNHKSMTIPYVDIKKKIVTKTGGYQDRHTGRPYELYYFVWKPVEEQKEKLDL